MPLDELLSALDTLIQALNKGGTPSAAFFADRAAELRSADADNAALRVNLKALSGCMPMAQYGGFSVEQEDLLSKVVDLASDCLATGP